MNTHVQVVILAAGLGTRMKSKKAKVLHQAGGRTLVEHVVRAAEAIAPASSIYTVIGHQADEVRKTLAHTGVEFVLQEEQKGTGHAVKICRQSLGARGGRLVVLYGDCPLLSPETLRRLVAAQQQADAWATVITTELDDPTGYGRILLDADGSVAGIVEQKAATPAQLAVRTINSGIYCFEAEKFWQYVDHIEPNNPVREYYLTDIVEIFRRRGGRVAPLPLADPSEVLGINTRLELADVDRLFRQRKIRQLLLDGVTIEKPETVTVDDPVEVGRDTVIGPFVQLRGATVIGEDCTVGACSILTNAKLDERVEVHPFTTVADSHLSAGASVGPYARLRMGADVAPEAHVGNFVELKNTQFGAKSKAMHLAYLGDATVGAGVNVGAGTITCNYDGVKKHRTAIGDGVFVGSNATLVAPVELEKDAYVGAGSVVTEPVPAGALALGRGRQVNKEGWVGKRKAKSATFPEPAKGGQ